MKKYKKIILGILTGILIIYISLCLVFYAILNISKNYINRDKMEKIVDNINVSNIIKNTVQMSNIKNELLDTGLSNDSVEQFLDSNEVKTFENEVVINVIQDILKKGNIEYKFDSLKINELLYNNITELQNTTQYSTLVNKVESKIPILIENANSMLDKVANEIESSSMFLKYKNYINSSFKIFDIIYSNFVNFIIVFLILSFLSLIIFIRNSILKSFKWIGISFVSSSIIIKLINNIITKFIKVTNFNKLNNIINKDFNIYVFLYLILGIILIITNVVIYLIKRKKTANSLSY